MWYHCKIFFAKHPGDHFMNRLSKHCEVVGFFRAFNVSELTMFFSMSHLFLWSWKGNLCTFSEDHVIGMPRRDEDHFFFLFFFLLSSMLLFAERISTENPSPLWSGRTRTRIHHEQSIWGLPHWQFTATPHTTGCPNYSNQILNTEQKNPTILLCVQNVPFNTNLCKAAVNPLLLSCFSDSTSDSKGETRYFLIFPAAAKQYRANSLVHCCTQSLRRLVLVAI